MRRMKMVVVAAVAAAALAGCGRAPEPTLAEVIRAATATVGADRIVAADAEPGNWLAHGRTYDEQRHSPLVGINDGNVGDLGLAWYWDTGDSRGLEATPIVVDGVMFSTGTWSRVYANDGRTGELIWRYDPQVPKEWGKFACCDVVNRGVAVWKGRVFVGTLDGRLVALDAGTGEVIWEVLTIDRDWPYTITGAPRVVNDLVVIGNGGGEYGVRGYVTAYNWETGDERWRFWTVPGDPSKPFENPAMELAAPTWNGEWWKAGGGGTVWDSMAFDPDLNLLYIGVGNGTPWNRDLRSPGGGDNLYLASIVALDPDDGSMVWHYQTTPGETWDFTATQHMILADVEIGGELRKVIMQAPKNGFFYVLDRTDGAFISAEPYVPVNWASHVDPATGRPVEIPGARYADSVQLIAPSPHGGHNWHPMAYNPDTGYVYVPALDMVFPYGQAPDFEYKPGEFNTGIDIVPLLPPKTVDGQVEVLRSMKGHLAAWDPVARREVWRVQHPTTWNGGLLSTAGNLVFQGRSDGYFAAYGADSGALLWETPVHMGIIAAPVTYTVDGEQYVAVVAGWGGSFTVFSGVPRHKGNVLTEGRILAFKLGGRSELPEPAVTHVNIPEPPDIEVAPEVVARGELLYHTWCSGCHGSGVTSGSNLPDLKYLSAAAHESWEAIVRGGAYATAGMPGFDHVLSEADSGAVHAYVVNQTRAAIAFCESEYPDVYPELFGTACTKRVVASEAVPNATTDR
ncbi:MAG: PQQ-dependent dehydrogenase, methanol/ethanol family [Gammaproteobacteria bacterium]|nr:PQQ-dependent dehydrogenase, methanol/ethanol family [Gammaproteobacteria bacterium]